MADRTATSSGSPARARLRGGARRRSAKDVAVDLIAGAFALLPLWWAIGVEQLVWAPVGIAATIVVLASRRRIRMPAPLLMLAIALVPIVASSAMIESTERIVTYARSVVGYVTFGAIAFAVANAADRRSRSDRLAIGIGIAIACDTSLGILAAVGVMRPTFSGPVMEALLPAGLAATDLGERFVVRSLGTPAWFSLFGEYFRLSGLFLFATMHAAALAIAFPFLVYLSRRAKGFERLAWTAILGVTLVNLALTTGRSAIAATLVGLAVFAARRLRSNLATAILLTTAALGGVATWAALPPDVASGAVERVLAARGSSTSDRLRIYDATLGELSRQPWIGFGTERDREDLPYPVGSHSFVLGFAYRHGVFALLLAIAAGISIWRSASRRANEGAAGGLGAFVEWSVIAVLLISLTDVLELDATTFALAAVVAGFALARPARDHGASVATPVGPEEVSTR